MRCSWYVFDLDDGLIPAYEDSGYKTKEDALWTLSCNHLDARKRVSARRLKSGYYCYERSGRMSFIVRSDALRHDPDMEHWKKEVIEYEESLN